MVAQAGVCFFESIDRIGQKTDLIGFRQTKIDITACDVVKGHEFVGDLVGHLHQILGTFAQQDPFLGQLDAETVPQEKFFAQFVLQGS